MDRRALILSGLAAALAGAGGAHAQSFERRREVPSDLRPRIVRISGPGPGEIHVVPRDFALYWTLGDGNAIRYACGIGRPGLYQAGTFYVGDKRKWPRWTPTPGMIAREPEIYAKWRNGMPGGPGNPLGARALYLYRPGGGDSFLRIHGSPDPGGLGREVSNGCARLMNEHVIALYDQVPLRTTVVLHPKG
ncbi:L,D-transpeptidase [Ovoidimarina sediminis]|uniref:L,D-transpeptidase n=1 Tax=Ovoidimarina sediminis TaxID=3079856 RepID=UPI0029085083|nr:L,D-transpeptidase [Rhodophyticola sp. MJ-SS7]MDU8941956.1 L,D-transpeptidase [Rhodophyticola sp. MJ-SS7]